MPDLLTLIAYIGIGWLVSFLINSIADTLPQDRLPALPTYSDGTARPPLAWSAILAFALGLRRTPSGASLSWRHWWTEVGTAAAFGVAVWVMHDKPLIDVQKWLWLVYLAMLILITVIDIEHRLIFFVTAIPLGLLALLDAALTPSSSGPNPNLSDALIGAAVGFGTFFIFYLGGMGFVYITSKLRGEELDEVAFGYGDVILAAACGAILGWQRLIFAMMFTVFLGAFGAIVYMAMRVFRNQGYSAFTPLPYGPYIVAGTLIMLFFNNEVATLFGFR
jgi:leader peptidase (prepilin peptidase) / N-methyltransferase